MRAPGRGVEVSQRVSRAIAGSSDLVPNLGNLTKYLLKKRERGINTARSEGKSNNSVL